MLLEAIAPPRNKTAIRIRSILIAESDASDMFIIRRAFEKAGNMCSIHCVEDGAQVIGYLSGDAPGATGTPYPLPDLLLMDLKMPKKHGFDVLRWLQTRPDLDSMAVVVLSGSLCEGDVRKALALGADEFYLKPSAFGEMVGIAGKLLARWLRPAHVHDFAP